MSLDHAFYFVATVLGVWCATIRLAKGLTRAPRLSARILWITAVVSVAFALVPLGRFSLWRWLFSAHANPSVPLLGVLALYVLGAATGRSWFSRRDWRALWWVGAGLGTWLYLPVLGLAHYDAYAVHWEGRWIAAGATVLAMLLLLFGNRAGLLIVAALLGHLLGVLESVNLWDYLVDPFFWLLSLGGLLQAAFTRTRSVEPAPRASL